MKLLIPFILGLIVFYWIRRLINIKRQSLQKPAIRTITEAKPEIQSIEHKEKNNQ